METGQFEAITDQLGDIKYLLEVLASDKLRMLLEQVLTTAERRKVWALCNGLTPTEEIARRAGLSLRAVQLTIKELVDRDLVTVERRGHPRRRFEFTPSDWRILP